MVWGEYILWLYEVITRYEVLILLIVFILLIFVLRSTIRQRRSLRELDANIEKTNKNIEDLKSQLKEIAELQNKNIEMLHGKIAAIKCVLDEMKEKKEELELEALINDAIAFRNRLFNRK
ncbi:MAG: hypothetical protein ACE5K4_02800 [Candidatus Hydrothermarchaeota archaeon]